MWIFFSRFIYIMGIYTYNTFQKIASVSPSVWFLNFVQYMQQNQVHASEVYMSLGDKEANAKIKLWLQLKLVLMQ